MKLTLHTGHVAAAVLAAAFVLPLPVNGAIAGVPALCPAWNLFGVPCPFCGMTRSFVCIGHGDFSAAFAYHPLGPLLFVSTAVFAAAGFSKGVWRPSPPLVRLLATSFAAMLGAAWVLRLCGFWPLPAN